MVWRFLKHYGTGKANEMLEEFVSAVVTFDPASASRAQIGVMQAELTKLGQRLAEAEAEVEREHRETRELSAGYERHMTAAVVLQDQLVACDDPARRRELERSLARIVERLERLKPEIEREESEDREVGAWATELRRSFEQLGKKLRSAEGDLRSVRRRMEMAELQRQRAAGGEQAVGAGDGITSVLSTISVALNAMTRETAKVRAETRALELKAGLLQVVRLDGDPHIAAALARADDGCNADTASLHHRLAALRDSREPVREAA